MLAVLNTHVSSTRHV